MTTVGNRPSFLSTEQSGPASARAGFLGVQEEASQWEVPDWLKSVTPLKKKVPLLPIVPRGSHKHNHAPEAPTHEPQPGCVSDDAEQCDGDVPVMARRLRFGVGFGFASKRRVALVCLLLVLLGSVAAAAYWLLVLGSDSEDASYPFSVDASILLAGITVRKTRPSVSHQSPKSA